MAASELRKQPSGTHRRAGAGPSGVPRGSVRDSPRAADAQLRETLTRLRGESVHAARIRIAVTLRAQAERVIAATIADARQDRVSWQVIGDALDVSRQAAFQRYGKPIDPRTGVPMNLTPLPEAAPLTATVIDDLAASEWAKVTARFDPEMVQAVSEDSLAEVWAQVVSQVGILEGSEDPEIVRAAELTVTTTRLNFEAGEFLIRIAFRDDQSIAGLYILPPGATG